jgi:uncharacterized membrane protein
MNALLLYVATALVFFAVDLVGLRFLLRPLFDRHLGDWLLDEPRLVPAAIFYLFYVGALVWFVSWPALRAGAPVQAALNGAILGALAYGTYEFTNYATLRAWSAQMVAVDLLWGAALTALAAWAGVTITRALT